MALNLPPQLESHFSRALLELAKFRSAKGQENLESVPDQNGLVPVLDLEYNVRTKDRVPEVHLELQASVHSLKNPHAPAYLEGLE